MYKTSYVCDCCGAEMTLPMYTLELSTNSLCIQDRASWHYCDNCWENFEYNNSKFVCEICNSIHLINEKKNHKNENLDDNCSIC